VYDSRVKRYNYCVFTEHAIGRCERSGYGQRAMAALCIEGVRSTPNRLYDGDQEAKSMAHHDIDVAIIIGAALAGLAGERMRASKDGGALS